MKEQNQLKIDIKTDIDRSERINLLCSCGETEHVLYITLHHF